MTKCALTPRASPRASVRLTQLFASAALQGHLATRLDACTV